jgi:hypothetical protein
VSVKIITEYIYPPIPNRNFDWRATWDGYEPGDPMGYGKTEQEAIVDFREVVGLDENDCLVERFRVIE